MNRIILIGNGFDLAHGLPTGYCDFIKHYWNRVAHILFSPYSRRSIDDGLMHIEHELYSFALSKERRLESWDEMRKVLEKDEDATFECKSPFFERINQSIGMNGWVDVENEYYALLKFFLDRKIDAFNPYDKPRKLNDDLELLKEKIVAYLINVQKESISRTLVKDCIRKRIYEPFDVDDISLESRNIFDQFLKNRLISLLNEEKSVIETLARNYGSDYSTIQANIEKYRSHVMKITLIPGRPNSIEDEKHLEIVYDKKDTLPACFLWPDQILLLNFNYTKTADLYLTKGSDFKVNHIHGELGNEHNPIIFGYGDEMDEDYKTILNLNDNDYLRNIKSIRYLETDSLRRLLSFIDSAPYQIYIMGHSCGNSDRTLLNTLFEHRNCVSIKPFYHQRDDGTDNYNDIVQNISRNFNSMQVMRDRVVNKSYCKPLVPLADR